MNNSLKKIFLSIVLGITISSIMVGLNILMKTKFNFVKAISQVIL